MSKELINVVITVENEEQKETILQVLESAEMEEIDFSFGCRITHVNLSDYLESNNAR